MSFRSFLEKDKKARHLELKDVCKICTGLSFKSDFYGDNGFPIIKGGNIQDGQITTDNLSYCNPQNYPKANLIKYEDVVMTAVGACCGKVGINLTDQEFFFSNNVLKFLPDEKFLTKRYLYHFLLSQQEEIKGMRKGSSQPFIGQSAMKKLKIPIPSLETQMKIANVLDKFREIEREISLRDKQYEYYRNYLIMDANNLK